MIGKPLQRRREKSSIMEVRLPFSPAEPCGFISLFLLSFSLNREKMAKIYFGVFWKIAAL